MKHTPPFGAATPATCIDCGSGHLHRHGLGASGHPRMKCQACGTTFDRHTAERRQAPTRASLRMAVARDMFSVDVRSCRALAEALGVSHPTVHRAREDVLTALERTVAIPPALQTALVSAATVRLRESRKGSRAWQRHRRDPATHAAPDRPQWYTYGGTPPADIVKRFQVTCIFTADRAGRLGGAVLDDDATVLLEAIAAGAPGDITPIVRNGGLVRSDGTAVAGGPPGPRLTTVGDLADRFRSFHARVGHVATQSLPRHLPWFLQRVTLGLSLPSVSRPGPALPASPPFPRDRSRRAGHVSSGRRRTRDAKLDRKTATTACFRAWGGGTLRRARCFSVWGEAGSGGVRGVSARGETPDPAACKVFPAVGDAGLGGEQGCFQR